MKLDDIRQRCEQAYNWAINKNYPSVAAQYAKTLAVAVDELQAQLAAEKRRADAAEGDLELAESCITCIHDWDCEYSNSNGCSIANYKWRGVKEEQDERWQDYESAAGSPKL